jgi:hypothetical protein
MLPRARIVYELPKCKNYKACLFANILQKINVGAGGGGWMDYCEHKVNYIIGNQSDYTVHVQLIGAYNGSHNAS